MSGLPGLKLNIVRMVGMIINYIIIILLLAVFIPIQLTNSVYPMWLIVIPIIAAGGLIFFLKTEIDAIDDSRPLILAIFIIVIGVIQGLILLLSVKTALVNYLLYDLPVYVALIAIVIVSHYTLSIYKNEKMRYYIAILVFNGCWLMSAIVVIGLWSIVLTVLSVVSVLMVIIAEQMMIDQKLLKFI
jgi:hypothetical protein